MNVTCTKCGYTQKISNGKGAATLFGMVLVGVPLALLVGPAAGVLGGGAVAKSLCNSAAKATTKKVCLPKCPKCGGNMQ
ncbi:MAG: hypothetical protein IJT89_09875 [Bacteroidaceae bacterium]|nr:hypothetical protein [Bacteroidaceae bacterium]